MWRILWISVGVLAPGCAADDEQQTNLAEAEVSDDADFTADGSDGTDATDGAEGPIARVDPESIYFGQIDAHATESREVRVENVGSADLIVSGFRLTGHAAFGFVYSESGSDVTQAAEPDGPYVHFASALVLTPGESTLFHVSFSPESAALSTGTLTLYTNDAAAEHQIGLLANDTLPCLAISPAKVEFGGRPLANKAVFPVEIRSCGGQPVHVTAILFASNATATFNLGFASLPAHVAPSSAAPLTVAPGQTATFDVEYTPTRFAMVLGGIPLDLDGAQIQVTSNASEAAVDIGVSGFGSVDACPTPAGKIQEGGKAKLYTNLHLLDDGSVGATGAVVKRQWSVEQPPGSQGVFIPSATVTNPTFQVSVAGKYTFTLDVWDEAGVKSCVPWQGVVLVGADDAIHVELVWHTPNDTDETDEGKDVGTDLNLHFAHTKYAVGSGYDLDKDGIDDPWFHAVYDCYWFNPAPNWGSFSPTADDDPRLDRDDVDGAGPENITLENPQNNTDYQIGVHYWSDHGFGDSYATVRIYLYQELVAEFANVLLSQADLWCVARISWPSGVVTPCVDVGGHPKITPGYHNPNFIPL